MFLHGDGFNLNWLQFRSGTPTPTPTLTLTLTRTPVPTSTSTHGPSVSPGGNPGAAYITTFKNGKAGAYSPTYDDGLWDSMIGTKATAILNGEGENTKLRISYEGTDKVEYIDTIDQKPEGVGMEHFLE